MDLIGKHTLPWIQAQNEEQDLLYRIFILASNDYAVWVMDEHQIITYSNNYRFQMRDREY